MTEQRRKGEPEGKKLPFSERLINYAKAVMIVSPLWVPLGGAALYGNFETIKSVFPKEQIVDEAPIQQDVEPSSEIKLSCPACPSLTCPDTSISLINHEEEYHQ